MAKLIQPNGQAQICSASDYRYPCDYRPAFDTKHIFSCRRCGASSTRDRLKASGYKLAGYDE